MAVFKRYLQIGSMYNMPLAQGEGLCLLTCKEIGFFLKSMFSKNISSFALYFRRLATLSSSHMTGAIQLLTLFTSDQVSLLQLSKNWGSKERGDREDNHTLAHTR